MFLSCLNSCRAFALLALNSASEFVYSAVRHGRDKIAILGAQLVPERLVDAGREDRAGFMEPG